MSMDTIMELEDEYSFDSNTNAIVYGVSDHSGSGESMISGPNIPLSSSDSDDDYHQEQQISTAARGGTDDLTVSSCASSSWFTNNNNNNNNKQIEQEAIMIFNVDFRALSKVAVRNSSDHNEVIGSFKPEIMNVEQSVNLNSCGETVREGENEAMVKDYLITDQLVHSLLPLSWYIWENEVMMKDDVRAIDQIINLWSPVSLSSFWDRQGQDVEGTYEMLPMSPVSWSSFSERGDDDVIAELVTVSPS